MSRKNDHMKNNHMKKLVAPIIITVLLIIAYILWGVSVALFLEVSIFLKLIWLIIPIILIGVCIYVLIERIIEIRSGEEDDLSKY